MTINNEVFDDGEFIEPSKSQKKRDAEYLQEIGEKLIALKSSDLDKLNLPERLLSEILIAKKITSNIALKRQKQFIGKVMRGSDATAIISALNKLDTYHAENVRAHHAIENWVLALLSGNTTVIDDIRKNAPQVDIQHVRNLQRNAIKELAQQKTVARKALFRYLKEQRDINDLDAINEEDEILD